MVKKIKYRKFGKLDWNASVLGFGAMRLPTIDGDSSKIDEPTAIKMIRYAIDNGVNYIDTAYPYHRGQSEYLVGKVLKNGYRDKVRLATKMPSWLINDREDMDCYLDEQLRKLQTDHIDLYLIHTLNRDYWPHLKDLGLLEFLDSAINTTKDGGIIHYYSHIHADKKTDAGKLSEEHYLSVTPVKSEILDSKIVRAVGPRYYQTVVDVKISK